MSANNKIKKQILSRLRFEPEMYTSFPGSILICGCMFAENKPEISYINKLWRRYKKHNYDFGFTAEDPEYIKKILNLFNVPEFDVSNCAYVQSKFNALIAPYINGQLYPLREDGIYTLTLRKGKVYPLVNGEKKDA